MKELPRGLKLQFIFIPILCIVEWFGTTNNTYAQSPAVPTADISNTGNGIWMVVQVIFALVFIIALFYFIIKVLAKKNKLQMSGRSMKTLGGVSLGTNKSLQVVEIGHSLYIVGVGNDIQLVSKIEDQEEIAYIRNNLHIRGVKDIPALQSLGKWINGLRNRPMDGFDADNADVTSFQEVFQSKMDRLSNRKQLVDDILQADHDADRLYDKR